MEDDFCAGCGNYLPDWINSETWIDPIEGKAYCDPSCAGEAAADDGGEDGDSRL